jgi:hypothetical protein
MSRPWRHPFIAIVVAAMIPMVFFLFVMGVYGLACSVDNDQYFVQQFVGNWPGAIAGTIWISLAVGAMLIATVYGYRLLKSRIPRVKEFKELETITTDEASELLKAVEDSEYGNRELGGLWS